MSDEGEIRWYWGVAFMISAFGAFAAFWGFAEMRDAQKLENHYEVCASVAETIEGFRACTNHER